MVCGAGIDGTDAVDPLTCIFSHAKVPNGRRTLISP